MVDNSIVEIYDWSTVVPIPGWPEEGIRLNGRVRNHPFIPDGEVAYPSTPMEFDEENRILKTYSGRIYKLLNCVLEDEEAYHFDRLNRKIAENEERDDL